MSADGAGAPQPVKQECLDVVEHIYEYVDGEVSPQALAAVREHLLSCPPCLEQHDVQVALKALVKRCCQDTAPASLRVRILARITETRVTEAHTTETRVVQAQATGTRVTEVRLLRE